MARSGRSRHGTGRTTGHADGPRAGLRGLDYLAGLILGGVFFLVLTAPANQDRFEQKSGAEPMGASPAMALGEREARVEDAALDEATNGVYRFRSRHPWIYGVGAFILGGLIAAIFVVIPYLKTTYESPDLTDAMYRLVIGCTGGGVAAVVLAFAYTAAIRPTVGAMRYSGITEVEGSAIAPPRPAQ